MHKKHEDLSGSPPDEVIAAVRDGEGTPVYVVDHRQLHRQGLASLIKAHSEDLSVIEAESVGEAASQLAQAPRDAVVLVTGERDASGHCARMDDDQQVAKESPGTPVLVVCACRDISCMRDCIGKGAKGFITPDSNGKALVEALHFVRAGGSFVPMEVLPSMPGAGQETAKDRVSPLEKLTGKERQVLELLCSGQSNQDIAAGLAQSENTVKSHINRILKKLDVRNRTQAVLAALPYVTGGDAAP